MRGWVLLAAMMMAGCHMGLIGVIMTTQDQGPYLPETLAAELGPKSVRTIGCLDVGFAVHERDGAALLDLHVGNRCAHPEALDVGKLAMRGVDEKGEPRAVTVRDPRQEITRLHVGGAEKGRERLRLQTLRDGTSEPLGSQTLARLCFDLEAVAPDSPEARPAPICLERNPSGWKPAT